MSWKYSGSLVKGPPTGSNTNKLDPRFRPNLGGLTAFQREQQLAQRYGPGDPGPSTRVKTEWDVLKENHRFIRDDEEPNNVSWEERLARAYESKLFKEFALIDLKHYKSRRLALRWRTAPEVVEGLGEDTCASLRCKYHQPIEPTPPSLQIAFEGDWAPSAGVSQRGDDSVVRHHPDAPEGRTRESGRKSARKKMPALRAFELPFVYEEAGERKEALVKVKLCPRCQAKLTWKPGKADAESDSGVSGTGEDKEEEEHRRARERDKNRGVRRHKGGNREDYGQRPERKDDGHRRKREPDSRRDRYDDRWKRDDGPRLSTKRDRSLSPRRNR